MNEIPTGNIDGVAVYPLSVYRYDTLARRGNPQVAEAFGMEARSGVSTPWALAEIFYVCSLRKDELARQRALTALDWDEAVGEFFLQNDDRMKEFSGWLEDQQVGKEAATAAT